MQGRHRLKVATGSRGKPEFDIYPGRVQGQDANLCWSPNESREVAEAKLVYIGEYSVNPRDIDLGVAGGNV